MENILYFSQLILRRMEQVWEKNLNLWDFVPFKCEPVSSQVTYAPADAASNPTSSKISFLMGRGSAPWLSGRRSISLCHGKDGTQFWQVLFGYFRQSARPQTSRCPHRSLTLWICSRTVTSSRAVVDSARCNQLIGQYGPCEAFQQFSLYL